MKLEIDLPRIAKTLSARWLLILLLLLCGALGVLYNVKTPPFENWKEAPYYINVQRWGRGEGFALPLPGEDDWTVAEVQQPPLYYALGTLLTMGVDRSYSPAFDRNPYAVTGDPDLPGDRNAVLHLTSMSEAQSSAAQGVRVLRGFSMLWALVVVALTAAIARELLPDRPWVAYGAAALVAFNPQFVTLAASAGPNTLLIALSTLALYLSMRLAGRPLGSWQQAATLGGIIGLASLTDALGLWTLALLPLAYLGQVWRLKAVVSWRQLFRHAAVALGSAVLVGGWWYLRNLIAFGHALDVQTPATLVATQSQSLPVLRVILKQVQGFWGVFGWANIQADAAYYTFAGILTALGLFGLLIRMARAYWEHHMAEREQGARWIVLAIWAGLMAVASLMLALHAGVQRADVLWPAISGIGLLIFLGISGWFPRLASAPVAIILAVGLIAFSAVVPYRYIQPAYALPQTMSLEQVPPGIADIDLNFEDELFLLGYELEGTSVRAGKDLHLTLYWLARKAITDNYGFRVQVYGRDGLPIGMAQTSGGGGNYPTRLWVPGEVLREELTIPIDGNAEAPVAAWLRIRVYAPAGERHLTAVDTQGRTLGTNPQVARFVVAPARPERLQPEYPLNVTLGDKVILVGYDLVPETPVVGQPWQIVLYWKPLGRISQDYTVFAHLVDASGELVAQADAQPLRGDYPTSFWLVNETVRDTHSLAVPRKLPTGNYELVLGLYLLETGERLPVAGSDPPTSELRIGPVYIEGISAPTTTQE